MYADPAAPTCDALSSSPLPFSLSRPPMAPTMVTARPSRIHTVPRPPTTIQCHLDQGNRSIRAGMLVSMVLSLAVCVAMRRLPGRAPDRARDDDPPPAHRMPGGGVLTSALPAAARGANAPSPKAGS